MQIYPLVLRKNASGKPLVWPGAVIENGLYQGQKLGQLANYKELWGTNALQFGGNFPLLVNIASGNRSGIKINPRIDGKEKSMAWYVIDALGRDGHVFLGLEKQRSEIVQAVKEGKIHDILGKHRVQKGDAIIIPSQMLYGRGEGLVMYEIYTGQGKSLSVARPSGSMILDLMLRDTAYSHPFPASKEPLEAQHFILRKVSLSSPFVGDMDGSTCAIVTACNQEAKGSVYFNGKKVVSFTFDLGRTMILPASLGPFRIEGTGELLIASIPKRQRAT